MAGKKDTLKVNSEGKLRIVIIVITVIVIALLMISFYWLHIRAKANNQVKPGMSDKVVQVQPTKYKAPQPEKALSNDKEVIANQSNSKIQTSPGKYEVQSGQEKIEIKEKDIQPDNNMTNSTQAGNTQADQKKTEKELKERQQLISQASQLALGYDYDSAISLLKSYQGEDGDYKAYKDLTEEEEKLKTEKASLVLYGGSYQSVTQINHIFFHSLIADNTKAFDGDRKTQGYNTYMATIPEFKKIIQKMYEDGYVLVRVSDLVKKKTLKDGTTKYIENKIYLRKGKKPFVLSQDDVNYYKYMTGDGFASKIVIGSDGLPTCEMINEDGTTVTGAYDMVPILDAFVREHPDFSYKGAKGLLALTGYEGVLGYRTNNISAHSYQKDKKAAKKVVDVMKAEGWEFGCHSWGHKNMQTASVGLLERDTTRWLKEVEPIVGPTDIYVFPFGSDIETTVGTYKSEKFYFLKKNGFNIYLGVYKVPWMQIKKDYVRMTRRPIDGQAMLEFPGRLSDLFDVKDIVDPDRPKL